MKTVIHTNCDVVIVPPMEAVWLTGPAFTLHDGRGCLSFEVKGDNDATVLLKEQSGSRRWQHLAAGGLAAATAAARANGGGAAAGAGPAAGRAPSPVDQNYTVILGSHRNSCLKFEKDGELCCMVANAPGAQLSSSSFRRYWINYDNGCISVGRGEPGEQLCATWTDPDPIENIRFAGLSAWDKHVGYRNLRMHPALQPPPASPPPKQQRALGGGSLAGWEENNTAAVEQQQQQQQPWQQQQCSGQQQGQQQQPSAVPSLLRFCQSTLLAELSPGSVCDVLQVADCLSPVLDSLRSQAVEYAGQNFQRVVQQDAEGFCSLSTACLEDILCSQSLDCPEKMVFDAAMKWVGYGSEVEDGASPCHPMQDIEQLLPCIRFPLMQDSELELVRRHAMWGRSSLMRELVQEAVDARQEEEGGGQRSPRAQARARGAVSVQDVRHVRALTASERLASTRFQMRRAPGCTELIYMYDGDKNGVCWHLGTAGGTQPWVNPVLAGRLQVRASSPACRSTDPKAVVGNNFARCNFAGPRMENGQLSSWWVLDLGPEHQLICNYYTLRHDGSTDFLRSWVLQGSNDGTSWADLRRHISDRTIRMPGQYATWAVSSHAAAVPYRFFRLLLVGPNPEAVNKHHICLSYWELYGGIAAAVVWVGLGCCRRTAKRRMRQPTGGRLQQLPRPLQLPPRCLSGARLRGVQAQMLLLLPLPLLPALPPQRVAATRPRTRRSGASSCWLRSGLQYQGPLPPCWQMPCWLPPQLLLGRLCQQRQRQGQLQLQLSVGWWLRWATWHLSIPSCLPCCSKGPCGGLQQQQQQQQQREK